MGVKTEDFKYIEECIRYIMDNDSVEENLCRIERTLSRVFQLTTDSCIEMKVSVCDNTTNNFFGVYVFPTVYKIDSIVESIMNDKVCSEKVVKEWQSSTGWYIELDSEMLYGLNAKFNPAEITALLLYQIGSVMYSSKIPVTLNYIFRYKFAMLSYEMKALLTKSKKIRSLMSLAVLEACVTRNYVYLSDNSECNDIVYSMMKSFDYVDTFNGFIGKYITMYGNEAINRTSDEVEKEINVVVNWCFNLIKQLEFRTTELRNALKTEMINNNSVVVKHTVQSIYDNFFGTVIDNYRVLLSEQFTDTPKDVVSEIAAVDNLIKEYKRIVSEAATMPFDKNGKLKKVNQLDIDVLAVDIDRIETHDDKVYLLDRLYDMLQVVEAGLEYIEHGESGKVAQSKSTLLGMKNRLLDMRTQILSTRIIEKEYGVFIKYPKGYEH